MLEGGKAMSDDQLYRLYLSGKAAAGEELMLRYADALTTHPPLGAYIHLTGT